jgi:predicted nucleotidyltransferase
VKQLTPEQLEIVSSLSKRLGAIEGVKAVVLGGSFARERARPGSDIDLGVFYSEAAPFSIQHIREVAEDVNDFVGPVVTNFYEWGPWVNGGAWLTIGGQRFDFIYRNLDHVERTIAEAEAGRYEVHYLQQPPFGFFSATYLGEIAVCIPLFDPDTRLDVLKRRVHHYPEALRRVVLRDYLFMVEFGLTAVTPKFAAQSDAFGTGACLTRALNELVMALFALNRKYPLNDKTALDEVAEFERAPHDFGLRAQKIVAHLGSSRAELVDAIEGVAQLFRETLQLTDTLQKTVHTSQVEDLRRGLD